MEIKETKTLFVKSSSPVPSLGSAIAHAVYEGQPVELRAIGAGSVSQAMKAVGAARKFVQQRGIDILLAVGFTDVEFPDKTMTAMTFEIIVR
jgi:stage V sporulation protein SpoVS